MAVWFASIYQNWLPSGRAVLLGLGIAVAAPLGDLFESFMKRDAGAKDTGRFFGAHGGALEVSSTLGELAPERAVAYGINGANGVGESGIQGMPSLDVGPGAVAHEPLGALVEPHVQGVRFQQLEKWNPVNAGRFHGHGGDTTLR